jgi:lysophospholipase L1-like esterase
VPEAPPAKVEPTGLAAQQTVEGFQAVAASRAPAGDGGPTARDAADANTPDTGGGGSGGFDPCPATGDCKILPLGDSITAGAGAQPGDGGGYRVELFTKAVADSKHITFVGSLTSGPSTVSWPVAFPKNHEGHIGWKIDQVSGIATTSQALVDMPQIVLLFIGTNDEGYASSEAGASDRLGQLIDKIVAALPNALLVVSSIYPFPGCKDTNYTPTQCAANVATYDAAIPGVIQQRVAQGKHLLSVDMSNPPTGALSTDGVHPNDTVGYPWMGDTWYAAIKSYLH